MEDMSCPWCARQPIFTPMTFSEVWAVVKHVFQQDGRILVEFFAAWKAICMLSTWCMLMPLLFVIGRCSAQRRADSTASGQIQHDMPRLLLLQMLCIEKCRPSPPAIERDVADTHSYPSFGCEVYSCDSSFTSCGKGISSMLQHLHGLGPPVLDVWGLFIDVFVIFFIRRRTIGWGRSCDWLKLTSSMKRRNWSPCT